ncbi:unnamed protein product [Blepharisma stoltei]|uniref:CRC domain-containing protein n=1 Tax=Blepharisma stoltei TaxID=1481888 RepID=A0AAU9ITW7_9CILI|nr:unnamed protein product [Blepharisma stoltei]
MIVWGKLLKNKDDSIEVDKFTHNSSFNCSMKNLWSFPKPAKEYDLASRFMQKLEIFKSFKPISIEPETKSSDEEENHAILLANLAESTPKKRFREETSRKKTCCNCHKSKCLKLYCECFAAREYCSGCSCVGCHNTESQENARRRAINGILERNPNAFKPKFKAVSVEGEVRSIHNRGCHCSKSGCLKKYCECYQNGNACSDICQCSGCKNQHNSKDSLENFN